MHDDKTKNGENPFTVDISGHKIMTLESDKRERLLNAALKEFINGYRKASTDNITKNSGISKGLLFHYFETKKGLFFYLINYVLAIITTEYEKVSFNGGDVLVGIKDLILIPEMLSKRYPLHYEFIAAAYQSGKDEFPQEFEYFTDPLDRMYSRLLHNSDRTLFRDCIDIEKALQIVIWTAKGYSEWLIDFGRKTEDNESQYKEIEKDLLEYIDILRKAFYKCINDK